MTKTNNKEDNGSPSRRPLDFSKKPQEAPVIKTENLTVDKQEKNPVSPFFRKTTALQRIDEKSPIHKIIHLLHIQIA